MAEIMGRIQGWHDRGGKELEDLAGPKGIAYRFALVLALGTLCNPPGNNSSG